MLYNKCAHKYLLEIVGVLVEAQDEFYHGCARFKVVLEKPRQFGVFVGNNLK